MRRMKMPTYVHLLGIYDADCNIYVYGNSASNEPIKTYQDLFAQLGGRLMLAVGKLRVDGVLVDACALDTQIGDLPNAMIRFTDADGKIVDTHLESVASNATLEDVVSKER